MSNNDWVDDAPEVQADADGWADDPPSASNQQNQKTSAAQTTLESYGDLMTFGHLPQIQSATEPVTDWIGEKLTGQKAEDASTYLQRRDSNIARRELQKKENPNADKLGAALGIGGQVLLTAGLGSAAQATQGATRLARAGQIVKAGAKTGAAYGVLQNPGDVEGELSPVQFQDRIVNGAIGAGFGVAAGVTTPLVGKAGSAVVNKTRAAGNKVADKLTQFADSQYLRATGGTGAQVNKFDDDAAKELRKYIKFGDSQKNISDRLTGEMKQAYKQIDDSLEKLEADGVAVDANSVYKSIREKITELKTNPAQAATARKLEKELDSLISATEAKGTTKFGIKEAEQVKRDYNKQAGDWTNLERGEVGKELYQTWRGAVEKTAQAADENTAKLFTEGKKKYGLLAPVEEAAGNRARVLQQQAIGGLLDVTAFGAGAYSDDPVTGVMMAGARRMLGPRVASSTAVTADKLAKMFRSNPKLAQFETKNPQAFQSMVNTLLAEKRAASGAASKAAENEPTTQPLKGNEKWASDGFDKLQKAKPGSEKFKGAWLQDPKAKQLLIELSDLQPGSKGFEARVAKLEALKGKS